MLNVTFLVGLMLFAISSTYFHFAGRNRNGLNVAFLVSFVTSISYVLMWQGDILTVTETGEPIFWTRWLFYIVSCTLLMVEIAHVKGIEDGDLVQILYLTGIVMFTGFLAARDLTVTRWVHFFIGSVAYGLLVIKILLPTTAASKWTNNYVLFGWTAFPIVFLIAPTGLGLIGAAAANALYLVLDIYTKIVFSIQLTRTSVSTTTA